MKSIAKSSFNSRFLKVQEDIKNLISILTGNVAQESPNEFDYFRQNATPEDIAQIEVLEASDRELSTTANEYRASIGNTENTEKKQSKEPQTTIIIKPISPNKQNTNNTQTISRNDDFDIEH